MRKIIHVDMDAFFASVEIRDNPKLKNRPVLIGRDSGRGVVATCSYEARKFGIHSAMPMFKALKLCPNATVIAPNISKYKEISKEIKKIFLKYTDLVEMVSIDEAYLDVTNNRFNIKSATHIAQLIKQEIFFKTKLTCSVGVSYNKFLAKVASDWNKPNGIFVIKPNQAQEFLNNLKISKFHGIGEKTEKKLNNLQVFFGKDLLKLSLKELADIFGKNGLFFYNIVRGIDNREVIPFRERKSIGTEKTFLQDINNINTIKDILKSMSLEVENQLKKLDKRGKTITIKIKYNDFKQTTHSKTLNEYIDSEIYYFVNEILDNIIIQKPVRLLGVTISNLQKDDDYFQPKLPFID